MTFKPVLALTAAAAMLAGSGAAFASASDVALIRTGDLDLASQVGQRTFDRRLTGAVTRVCGSSDAGSRFAVETCRMTAEKEARAKVRELGSASN